MTFRRRACCWILVAACLGGAAWGQSGPAPRLTPRPAGAKDPAVPRSTKPVTRSGWQTWGALAVVVGLIVGGSWLVKKQLPAAPRTLPGEVVKVLGRRALDHRNAIQLVRCGSRILVLANSPQHGLHTLAEITDPVEVDLIAGQCQQEEQHSATQRFQQLLHDRVGGVRAERRA